MDVSDWFVAKLIFPWVIISQVFHYARWLTHPLLEGCRPCIKGRGRKNIFWLAAKFFLVNLAAIFFAQFAVLWFRISWSLNLCKKKSMVSFVFRLSSFVLCYTSKGIHFHTCNMFRSHGKTVDTILSRKSRLPLFKKIV